MARNIGLARALKMCYFGDRESAETMFEWGYVSFLCNDGDEFENLIHEKASFLGNYPTTALFWLTVLAPQIWTVRVGRRPPTNYARLWRGKKE